MKSETIRANSSRTLGNIVEVHLRDIQGDVEDVVRKSGSRQRLDDFSIGADQIPSRDLSGVLSSQRMPRLYREHMLKFRAEKLVDPDIDDRQSIVGQTQPTHQQRVAGTSNFWFAYAIQSFLTKVTTFLFGMLAGIALVHTFYVNILRSRYVPFLITESNHWVDADGFLLVRFYGIMARPIAIGYFIMLTVIGVNLLDRADIQDANIYCVREAVAFQNAALLLPVFLMTYLLNNSMYFFDSAIHFLAGLSRANVTSIFQTSPSSYCNLLEAWRAMDAARTAGIIFTWLLSSLVCLRSDRMVQNLFVEASMPLQEIQRPVSLQTVVKY